ncbi:hypothetical protein OHD16_21560 [Sphingobacterium sp. ML3W]|uniref:hypothetical protein n=1 Tax=Sphingobacterium sp. ML3W TaxID=1538644 RepID=UPI00249CC1AA|nr:hypothetical protein [Sphingobacterium sp. ML3W]WFA77320.1 hypothetical protein OGI71_14700 [Sphingobacterium sp. ML3W]
MKRLLLVFILSLVLTLSFSCKKDDGPKMPEGTPTKFDIHTDQPITSLTVENKKFKKIIFPTQPIKVLKTYYDKAGNQIFLYSEKVNVAVGDRIEFRVPTKTTRKIFKVAIYENKFFEGFYEDNGNQVRVFVVPEKL